MAPRRRSLIRATSTPIREDRLTEILAVVLDSHRPFARRLMREADLPSGDDVEVSTQVSTPSGKRIDLQVVSLDGSGHPLARLWSEHKTGSPFSTYQSQDHEDGLTDNLSRSQLEVYADELEEKESSGRFQLITIVNRLDEAPDSERWKRLTWQDVAVMAAETGAERDGLAGLQWRNDADSLDARADQRLLHELLTYLEEEHNAVIEPISHLDVIALSRSDLAWAARDNLIRRARADARLDRDGGVDQAKGERRQNFKLPSSWAERLGGHAQLRASSDDPWASSRIDEPSFGVGFSLSKGYYDQLRDSSNRDWLEGIEKAGFWVSVSVDRRTLVFRTLYVAELISRGATLDQQAKSLASWIDESIEALQSHDPGISPSKGEDATSEEETAAEDEGDDL